MVLPLFQKKNTTNMPLFQENLPPKKPLFQESARQEEQKPERLNGAA